MTLNEVLEVVEPLGKEQRSQWLIALGAAMTISARAGYPVARPESDNAAHLMAFNEMQHQLYNYLTYIKEDWTIESFLNDICEKAKAELLASRPTTCSTNVKKSTELFRPRQAGYSTAPTRYRSVWSQLSVLW
jgi:hypothetical protein